MAISQVTTTTTGINHPATAWNVFRNADIDTRLAELNYKTPVFYNMLQAFGGDSDTTSNPRFDWGEEDIPVNITAADGAELIDAVSMDVIDGSIIRAGDIIRNMTTNELIRVTAVSTNTLTITRGWSGSTAVAIGDEDIIMVMHFSLGEGGDAPEAITAVAGSGYNYTSFFSRTFEMSELNNDTDVRFNLNQVSDETMKKAFEIRRDISNQLMYGKRALTVVSGQNHYESNGFRSIMNGASLLSTPDVSEQTWRSLNALFLPAFEPNSSSDSKMLICGTGLMGQVNKLVDDKTTYTKNSKTLGGGGKRKKIDSGQTVDMIFDRYTFNADVGASLNGALIDQAHVGLKWMQGWGLTWKQNIQDNHAHVRKDEIYGGVGLLLKNNATHRMIEGT